MALDENKRNLRPETAMSARWNRFLRLGVGLASFALGVGFAVFVYSNDATLTVHWRSWSLAGVHVWEIGILPALVGIGLGYLYHLPARLHHVTEHYRHRQRVHELEKELRELRVSFDKLVEMPSGDLSSRPAALLPPLEHEPVTPILSEEPDPRLADEPGGEERHSQIRMATKRSEGRRRLLAPLQAELAELKLGGEVPATVIARSGRARPVTKPSPKTGNGSVRTRGLPAPEPASEA
ncbi:MAG: hypothetical protein NVS9B1_24400 [Candidatus Dormibacteraceae bacterium]